MSENVVNLAASALTSWKAFNGKHVLDHHGSDESSNPAKRARMETAMMMTQPAMDTVAPHKPVLRPYPFFYYTDHSTEEDPDPLTPLTFPGRVPNFPAKLHAILSQPELAEIIDWLPHGRSWRVLKPREFEMRIIPKFFEHSKFSSFVRQANGWGFRRITQGPDRNSYYHEKFLRGLPHLCKTMKRPGVAEKRVVDPDLEPDFYKISQIHPVPANADEESIFLQKTLQSGPKARMPIVTGHFKSMGREGAPAAGSEEGKVSETTQKEAPAPPSTHTESHMGVHHRTHGVPASSPAVPSPVPRVATHPYTHGTSGAVMHREDQPSSQPPPSPHAHTVHYSAPPSYPTYPSQAHHHHYHVTAPVPAKAPPTVAAPSQAPPLTAERPPAPSSPTHSPSVVVTTAPASATACHHVARAPPSPLPARVAPPSPKTAPVAVSARAPAAAGPVPTHASVPAPSTTMPVVHVPHPAATAVVPASGSSIPGAITPEQPHHPKVTEIPQPGTVPHMAMQFPMPTVDQSSSASFAAGFAAATAHYQQHFYAMLNKMAANKQLPEGFTPHSIMAGMVPTASTQ